MTAIQTGRLSAVVLVLSFVVSVCVVVTYVSENTEVVTFRNTADRAPAAASNVTHARLIKNEPLAFYQQQLLSLTYDNVDVNRTELVKKIQEIRFGIINQFCRNRRRRATWNSPLRHTVYSKQMQFAYCAIGKVASSSWLGILKIALGDTTNTRRGTKMRPLRSVNEDTVDVFKFFFVRHPFERLISAFESKFVKKSGYWDELAPEIIRKYRRQQANESESRDPQKVAFVEFIRHVADVPVSKPSMDFHWCPQSLMCDPCTAPFDFIGHYETLNADSDFVLREIGIPETIRFRGKLAANVEQQILERIKKAYRTVDKSDIEKLKRIYRFDFEMFGYDDSVADF